MLVVTLRTAPGSAMPLITFERARSVYNVASIFHLGPDARKLYKSRESDYSEVTGRRDIALS